MALSPQQQMASSAAGAVTVSLLMTPLDVVKIRLQSQERLGGAPRCLLARCTPRCPPARQLHTVQGACSCLGYRPTPYTSTADAFVKIVRAEGVRSLWSGLAPTLLIAIPATVTNFTMYEQLRAGMARKWGAAETPVWITLTAGAMARVVAVTLVSPLELARTKMQASRVGAAAVRRQLAEVVRVQGARGLWHGYSATLLRDVPFSAIYWPLYEHSRAALTSLHGDADPNSFLVNFASGAAAGSVASTVTLPCDVIKTLKQVELGEVRGAGRGEGTAALARRLVAEQGWRSLFRGLTPRLLKVAPSCAIMISSYEWCKALLASQGLQG